MSRKARPRRTRKQKEAAVPRAERKARRLLHFTETLMMFGRWPYSPRGTALERERVNALAYDRTCMEMDPDPQED